MSDQKLSRRDFLRAAAGASAATAFGAFATSVAARPLAQDITVTMWAFATNRVNWMEDLIEELWAPANPNVTIDIEVTPYADLWPKLQATFVAGAGVPDIVDVAFGQLGQYMREEGSEPFVALNDIIGDEIDDLSIPSAASTWTIRDKIYGVGNEVNPVLLYYRADIFDELGLDAEAPQSWQEFVDTLGGPATEAGYGLFPLLTTWSDFYIQYHQAGGQFFDAEGNVTVVNDLAADILAWQKAQLDSGVYIEQGSGDAQYALMNADAYITVWGAPWYQGFMKINAPDLEGKWKMRYLPTWSDDSFLTVPRGGTGMCITAASENPEAAWEFIHMGNLTIEGSMLAFAEMNLFPSYIPTWDQADLLRTDDYFSDQKPGEFISTAAVGMAAINVDPFWSLFIDSIGRLAVEPVMIDGADPMTALQEAVDEFEFNK